MKIKPSSRRGSVTVELKRSDDRLLEKSAEAARTARPAFRLKRILVPMDFSEFASKALDYALAFAEQFNAQIVLLHVIEPVAFSEGYLLAPATFDELNQTCLRTAQEKLAALSSDRIGQRVPAETLVRPGHAYAEIAATAKELEVDLIILATHGYTWLKHVVLGSTAERVVRHAPCPVLTVRDPEREFVKRPARKA